VVPVLAQAAEHGAFEAFVDATTNGLSLGAIYALLAMGFVIIFKATQVVSFAHGAIAALGAYLTVYFGVVLNFPGRYVTFLPDAGQWILSAVVAIAATAVVGLVVERVAIRPMIGEPLFSIAMVTIGLDIVLRTVTNDYIGTDPRPLGDPWGVNVFEAGPISMAHTEIATIFAAIALVAGVAWFFRSRIGVAMRATAFDQEAAMAQGISVGRIFAIAWAIGAGLAAVAGIFSSVFPRASTGVVQDNTAFFAFRAFPAIIVGGLDSVPGAVVGGFIIGLAESFAGEYLAGDTFSFLGAGFSGIVPYLVMLGFLLIRPYGLFGTEEIRRV
jgi:branched-chain amino acid transport system permease protein